MSHVTVQTILDCPTNIYHVLIIVFTTELYIEHCDTIFDQSEENLKHSLSTMSAWIRSQDLCIDRPVS